MTPLEAPPANTVRFYSPHRGHVITINPGKLERNLAGQLMLVGESRARFQPIGHTPFGFYDTSNREEIEFLSKCPDLMTEEQYQKAIIPAEKRAEAAERTLQTKNRLIEQLEAENAKLKAAQQAGGGPIKPPTSSK